MITIPIPKSKIRKEFPKPLCERAGNLWSSRMKSKGVSSSNLIGCDSDWSPSSKVWELGRWTCCVLINRVGSGLTSRFVVKGL